MEPKRAGQFHAANRSLLLVIPLSILLLISVSWNVWHHRFDQDRLARAQAAECAGKAAAAFAREEANRAVLKRRAKYEQSEARIRQLYDEINHLTRVSERGLLPDQAVRKAGAENAALSAESAVTP